MKESKEISSIKFMINTITEIMTKEENFYIFRSCTCRMVYDDNLSREQMNEK